MMNLPHPSLVRGHFKSARESLLPLTSIAGAE